MRFGRARLFVAALTLLLTPVAARTQDARSAQKARQAQGEAQSYAELPNFQKVNERLYRGGQPNKGGLQRLAAMGVKTIINLRDDDARAAEEEREALSLGLRYFNLPLSRAGRPGVKRVDEVLALIGASQNQPVFIHCQRGADRTGVVVAAYRIAHDGWTGERALKEAEQYGLGWWQRGKKDFIEDYYRDHAPSQPSKKTEPAPKGSRR